MSSGALGGRCECARAIAVGEGATVPPFGTVRMPVTSLARLTSAVPTAPAVAFKNPESEAMESDGVMSAPVVLIVVVPVPPTASVFAENAEVDAFAIVVCPFCVVPVKVFAPVKIFVV